MADALHESVADAITQLNEVTPEISLDVELPDTMVRVGRRYSLQAHVDKGSTGEIKTGDLIITHNVPVAAASSQAKQVVTARMTRI